VSKRAGLAAASSGARDYQAVVSAPFGHVGIRTRDEWLVGVGGFMHSRATGPLSIKRWLLQHEGIR
jgi:hypothetical protein